MSNLSLFDPEPGTQLGLFGTPPAPDPPLIDDGGHGRPAGARGAPRRPYHVTNPRPASVDLSGGEGIGPIRLTTRCVNWSTGEVDDTIPFDLGDGPGWIWLRWANDPPDAATLYSFARSRRDPAGYMLQR